MQACVLIRANPGRVKKVVSALRRVDNIVKAFPVFGRYDVVAFVEAPDFESVSKASAEINAIGDVKSTETAIEG